MTGNERQGTGPRAAEVAEPPPAQAERAVAEDLHAPEPDVPPEPPKATGATASERASAQVAAQLSDTTRADGSRGPA